MKVFVLAANFLYCCNFNFFKKLCGAPVVAIVSSLNMLVDLIEVAVPQTENIVSVSK
jgi:hypothetical protein